MSKWARWKEGLRHLTLLQQLKAQRLLLCGQIAGLMGATAYLAKKGFWYWLPFLGFTILLLFLQLYALRRQIFEAERVERLKGGFL